MCNENENVIFAVMCVSEAARLKDCNPSTIERQCRDIWSKESVPRARKCNGSWIIDRQAVKEFIPRPKKIAFNAGISALWGIIESQTYHYIGDNPHQYPRQMSLTSPPQICDNITAPSSKASRGQTVGNLCKFNVPNRPVFGNRPKRLNR